MPPPPRLQSKNSLFIYLFMYFEKKFWKKKIDEIDEIQHTEIFAVVKFRSGKITEFFTIMLRLSSWLN